MHFDPASMSPEQITAAMASLDADNESTLEHCSRLIDGLPSARLVPAARGFLDGFIASHGEELLDNSEASDGTLVRVTVTLGDIRRLRRALAE